MYRFVECTKIDGKTHRTGGVTQRSLRSMRHLSKVGKLRYVRGYLYLHNGIVSCAVLVRGEKGSIRFGGFSWGYSGEGSRGLNELFDRLGVNIDATTDRLGEWPGFQREEVGQKWRLELPWKAA